MNARDVMVDPARAKESFLGPILGVTTFFHIIALVVVALRSYIRIALLRSFAFQDALMILAILCALLGGQIILYIQSAHGLGRHVETLAPADLTMFNKMTFVQSIVPLMGGLCCLKISIALELMKLKGSAWKWYKIILWCLIAFVIAYTILAWVSFFSFCQPMALFWDQSIKGKCYSVALFKKFGLANTGFNIFTDIALATLPVPIVWTLKLPFRTRLYLVGVLSLGYIAVIVGILKAVAQISYNPFLDNTYRDAIQFWGLLQLNLGIIAACAPSLKPLVRNVLGLGSSYNTSGAYTNSRRNRSNAPFTVGGTASRGYTKQSSRADGADNFEMDGKYRAPDATLGAYTANVERGDSSSTPYPDSPSGGRNSSQESILQDGRGKGIMKVTEVTIDTY